MLWEGAGTVGSSEKVSVREGDAEGSSVVPASPDCFSPATSQVALLKLQVDLMEGN